MATLSPIRRNVHLCGNQPQHPLKSGSLPPPPLFSCLRASSLIFRSLSLYIGNSVSHMSLSRYSRCKWKQNWKDLAHDFGVFPEWGMSKTTYFQNWLVKWLSKPFFFNTNDKQLWSHCEKSPSQNTHTHIYIYVYTFFLCIKTDLYCDEKGIVIYVRQHVSKIK